MILPPSISIIIAYHSGASYLKACLQSIIVSVREEDEIIVVINNEDPNAHNIDLYKDRVVYLHYHENLGYAKAVNIGVESCANEYVVISDHDIVFQANWLESLWKFYISDSGIGAVSCRIINALSNNVLDYGIAFSEFNFGHPFMDLSLNHELTNTNRITQMICAGGLLLRKAIFKRIGGFDESFGSLYTDLDLCLQLKKIGLSVGVASDALAYHFSGELTQANRKYKAPFLKSDVKGAFMRKNAELLETDMNKYYQMSADYFIAHNGQFKRYFFFNMMNVANPLWYEKILLSFNADSYDRIFRSSGNRDAENIRLFEALGYDLMVLGVPIAYFVDRFISLKDNSFWWKERRNHFSDIIIDRNGNIVSVRELLSHN